jgi:hypothetical protein
MRPEGKRGACRGRNRAHGRNAAPPRKMRRLRVIVRLRVRNECPTILYHPCPRDGAAVTQAQKECHDFLIANRNISQPSPRSAPSSRSRYFGETSSPPHPPSCPRMRRAGSRPHAPACGAGEEPHFHAEDAGQKDEDAENCGKSLCVLFRSLCGLCVKAVPGPGPARHWASPPRRASTRPVTGRIETKIPAARTPSSIAAPG